MNKQQLEECLSDFESKLSDLYDENQALTVEVIRLTETVKALTAKLNMIDNELKSLKFGGKRK
jgi:predicted RNase H-like nuclease (RuvC/YqgF family)